MATIIIRGQEQKDYAKRLIDGLTLAPTMVVEIKRFRKKRSLSQNALLHKWFGLIAEEFGDTPDGVKSDLKREFLPMVERHSQITGEITMEPKGTSELTPQEMADFMTRIEAWAPKFGIILPTTKDFTEN